MKLYHLYPQGGTLLCSIYIGWADFWGSNFWTSIFMGVLGKNNYFGGLEIVWIFLGGHF